MTARASLNEKIANWYTAFQAVRSELIPGEMRQVLEAMRGATDPGSIATAERLARMISASDRAASLTAAMLVSSGIRPVSLEDVEDPS